MELGSTSLSTSNGNGYGNYTFQPKHKVFLSHSGAQKGFVEQLCVDLERCDRHPFLDKRRDCLPIGTDFPSLIFEAIEQCEVGVVVLSEEFFTSKWPMLELVAMANAKKMKPSFTIMPIFFGVTFSQCCDMENHKRWLSLWQSWAECDSRIDVKDWENSLRLFGPTNGLKYNSELGEVKFREEIVEAICKLVPPRTRFEDSHVQGRSRLCKVVHEAIEESKVSLLYEVHVIGLYGVGGIGKTTICKAMCNDLSEEYHDKVCHVELGSQSEVEVFKEVLGKLTDINLECLGAMDVDKYRHHLMREMMNVKVFLTIDNVSSATTNQALTLLRAKYGPGSVLLVTARSLNELTSLGIDASECKEMPELELEEAMSLFLYYVACVPPSYSSNKDDLDLITSCVERCHFKKGDGISYHYHPLALRVLGEQLRCVGYVPSRWLLLLHEIDFLNPFGEPQHPVFSILRKSFDALNSQDQLLFMDVALYTPYRGKSVSFKWSFFEWFGTVHGVSVYNIMEWLENLKRKSILEDLCGGCGQIGMHDLWREFARLETKVGKFEERRWIFEWDEFNVLGEANVTGGGCLVNMRRMFFLDKGFVKLEDVNFACFPNVTILKLCTDLASVQDLDLRGLRHLKSLELESDVSSQRSKILISIVGLGSLSKLVFLRWLNIPSDSCCIDEISCLTNLRVLDLYGCGQVPNLSNLILLEVVCFDGDYPVTTISGLSLKHTNLQFLNLRMDKLHRCSGLGELVGLQELDLQYCYKLKEVPNLQKLKGLRKLVVFSCLSLRALPGLGELVALQELDLQNCYKLKEVPNLQKLKRLRKLDLISCLSLQALPGLGELVALEEFHLWYCEKLKEVPNLQKLKRLQRLCLFSCELLRALPGLGDLVRLLELHVRRCNELLEFPNMGNLKNLRIFYLDDCELIQSLPGLDELVGLQSLKAIHCKNLTQQLDMYKLTNLQTLEFQRNAPQQSIIGWSNLILLRSLHVKIDDVHDGLDLHNLTKLETLNISRWHGLGFSSLAELVSLESIVLDNCKDVCVLPNLERLSRLRNLTFKRCEFEDWSSLCHLVGLKKLDIMDCDKLEGLLDLRELARLEELSVDYCTQLKDLRGILGLQNLKLLRVRGHLRLQENLGLDLHRLTSLRDLNVSYGGLSNLQGLAACSQLHTLDCSRCDIQELPDLANFPNLSHLDLHKCVNLTKLICTKPLTLELRHLDVSWCRRLQALPDLTNSQEMRYLDVANSGVVLSTKLIEDMRARWPSIELVTGESSSHGIWRRIVGSLQCGCIGTSLQGCHTGRTSDSPIRPVRPSVQFARSIEVLPV